MAHASSSFAVAGLQVKILLRLGVSDTPDGFIGPVMNMLRRCGRPVIPACVPILTSINVCSTSQY